MFSKYRFLFLSIFPYKKHSVSLGLTLPWGVEEGGERLAGPAAGVTASELVLVTFHDTTITAKGEDKTLVPLSPEQGIALGDCALLFLV